MAYITPYKMVDGKRVQTGPTYRTPRSPEEIKAWGEFVKASRAVVRVERIGMFLPWIVGALVFLLWIWRSHA